MARLGILDPAPEYAGKTYRVEGRPGLAYTVRGWQIETNPETGDPERNGNLVVVAVGDDHRALAMPADLVELGDGDYCTGCGQLGCYGDAV